MIYVGSPYSHRDLDVVKYRIDRFTKFMASLIESGKHPVSPLMNHLLSGYTEINFPLTWEYWQEYSYKMLSACDELYILTLPGWKESTGVQAEIKLAEKLKLDIHYIEDEK